MGIIYLVFLVVLLITFLFIKKSDEKQNLFFWISLNIIILLSYNVFIVYLLSIVHIKSSLTILTIINIMFSVAMGIRIFKTKEIQKYFFNIKDIIFFVILSIVVLYISYINFGLPFKIKYDTTDPAVHYMAAMEFYNNSELLANVPKETFYDFDTFMIGAYVNEGLLFKAFSQIMPIMNFYKLFICFDIFMLLLTGMLFYSTILYKLKNKIFYIIGILVTIIYLLGYPLNSMIFGFSYLSLGLLIINALICLINTYKHKNINIYQFTILMFLLNFNLFFTYYLFVPYIYSAIGLYFLYIYKKGKFIISKKSIIVITITLIIPCILGFMYLIFPTMFGDSKSLSASGTLKLEGYIYRDLYSNFIFLVPFSIYYFADCIKNKKIKIENIISMLLIMFLVVLFVGGMNEKVSSYYFYKNYYVLWLITFITAFFGLHKVFQNNKILVCSFVLVYMLIISFFAFDIDKKIAETNYLFNTTYKSHSYVDIFKFNFLKINDGKYIYDKEQIGILNKANEYILNGHKIPLNGDLLQQLWFYSMLNTTTKKDLYEFYDTEIFNLDKWKKNEYKYAIYFNNDYFEKNSLLIKENTKELFKNNSGGILEKII